MTGEITLRGEVLPIGGLKEKLLAAHRGGIETVLIPHENERDLVDIPKNIKQSLDIRPVRWIDEVLELLLAGRAMVRSAPVRCARSNREPQGSTLLDSIETTRHNHPC
jgi:ATP-dependent Lon protease